MFAAQISRGLIDGLATMQSLQAKPTKFVLKYSGRKLHWQQRKLNSPFIGLPAAAIGLFASSAGLFQPLIRNAPRLSNFA